MTAPAPPRDPHAIPQAPLFAAAGLALACVLGVGAVSSGLIDLPAPAERDAAAAQSRDVRFVDLDDGGVRVVPAGPGRDVVIAPGEGAFIRGLARTLTRDRQMRGLGPETPFRLTRWSDGRLTMTDLATGKTLAVDGFGADNRRAFVDLLSAGAA